MGSLFFSSIGLLSAIGMALMYGVADTGDQEHLTIGTIVALGAYLGNMYGSLQTLTNAPVDFATSIVSFERVFEVIDLPFEVAEKPDATVLQKVNGLLEFEDVNFRYSIEEKSLLKDVRRYGQIQNVKTVLSARAVRNPAMARIRRTRRWRCIPRRATKCSSISPSGPNRAAWWRWLGPAEPAKPP